GAVDYVPVPVVPAILRAKVSIFAELFRKTRALERLNGELEERVAERTSALEATTQALQEAGHRKDEFLAMLAHELRNPLAPIRTAVQLLRLKELSEPHRKRARDVIERQVEHLVNLIDDLLDVSRITRGMITLQLEPVLIGAIVARAVETARPAIDAHRHVLEIDLPDELISVEGDKTRLIQVLANILHNAAKFMDPGGRIQLSVRREGPNVAIKISDIGIGIAPDLIPRIFELFTQVHSKSERAQGGLGIGLALVRRLTEMHGGSVSVHSDGPGRGAAFTVRLPVMASPLALLSSQRKEPGVIPEVEPQRILVADDNHDAAEALSLQLQLAGHDVRTAHDGAEAVAIARTFDPDIVLLDLGMPKMDGYEAARQLRLRSTEGRRLTLIALTGWGQQQDRDRTADAGFDEHLVKPVAEAQLFKALAAAAGKRKTEAQAG
ncbi:MAG TPA: ATP-binding protein, partial [Vicinamibacterales bacterium]|nr:ATP-binding protein [Vicinamibacterales bacterium]